MRLASKITCPPLPDTLVVEEAALYDDTSQSGCWFAEGEAAEQLLLTRTSTGPLPAVYQRAMVDDAAPSREVSIKRIVATAVMIMIAVIVLVAAISGEARELLTRLWSDAPAPVAAADQLHHGMQGHHQTAAPEGRQSLPAALRSTVERGASMATTEASTVADKGRTSVRKRRRFRRVAAIIRRGQRALRKGQLAEARQAFRRAMISNSKSARAREGLGEVAFELGDYRTAVRHLRSAIRLAPLRTRGLVMLANTYFKQGLIRQAVKLYRRTLKRDPRHRGARLGLRAATRHLARGEQQGVL